MNNPFNPKRKTKGKCAHCAWSIELYDEHAYGIDGNMVHVECTEDYNDTLE